MRTLGVYLIPTPPREIFTRVLAITRFIAPQGIEGLTETTRRFEDVFPLAENPREGSRGDDVMNTISMELFTSEVPFHRDTGTRKFLGTKHPFTVNEPSDANLRGT